MSKVDYNLLTELARREERDAIRKYLASLYTETHKYTGHIKAKERPRMTKTGRVYTAKETRQFEASVAAWARKLKVPKLRYPIAVTLRMYENSPLPLTVELSRVGLTYNEQGDIDNLAKAILDGMNRIMYKDDKQIAKLSLERAFTSGRGGFEVTLSRYGLSAIEYANFVKRYTK